MVNAETLAGWLHSVIEDKDTAIRDLKEMVDRYPYFNIAQILLTTLLSSEDNSAFREQLSRTAISVSDREQLYRIISGTLKEQGNEDLSNDYLKNRESLLENFLKNEPKIVPDNKDHEETVELAKKSNREDSGIISETLARIYIMQGNKAKAKQVYEKLGLKYPEKSAYFAGLIEELDNKE